MGIEVLAPAGSFSGLVAAVNAGADAVYIGGQKYGARAYAKNPEEEELIKGIEYAHHFGVKVYMTLNTLLKEREMEELYDYVRPYYEAGVDALIVQDFGVMEYIMKYFPSVDVHASTQMSIMGHEAAAKLRELGVTRVVPAREVSLQEICNIRGSSDIEIEGFVHGALCYSYSGQCFMSSLIGGRSANRGRCAGTCRLPFEASKEKKQLNKPEEKYLLSCKDLCSLDILPDVLSAGLDSLKIEGRMKSPRYTAGVVRIWRKYVDLYLEKGAQGYKVDPKDRRELLELYDRGGQTAGYYGKHNGKDMLALKEKTQRKDANEALFAFLDAEYVNARKKHKITGRIVLRANEPISLTVRMRKHDKAEGSSRIRNSSKTGNSISEDAFHEVTVFADAPGIAKKNAATQNDVRKQILKTGNTFYEFEDLIVDMETNLFVPVKCLNEARRAALEKLDEAILGRYQRRVEKHSGIDSEHRLDQADDTHFAREMETITGSDAGNMQKRTGKGLQVLHLCAETKEQLEGITEFLGNYDGDAGIKVSFEADALHPKFWKDTVENGRKYGAKMYLYLPHIFRLEARAFFEEFHEELIGAGFDGFLIRSLEESEYIKRMFSDAGLPRPTLHFDYNMYAYNTRARSMNRTLGADVQTLSVELNLKELQALGGENTEAIVYGRLPMMVSAQCIKKTTVGCDHVPELLYLKDRQNEQMPVKNKCTFCYNHIYNAKPLSTLGIAASIKKLEIDGIRLLFTTEDKEETVRVAKNYENAFFRNGKPDENMDLYTRGHYKRGIE